MKFAKLSLAALMALSVSAFADVNVKFGGDAKLFYSTSDKGKDVDLFAREGAMAQTALNLGASLELPEDVQGKVNVTMLSTLGLERQLVNSVWDGGLGNQWWASEAWLAKSFGNTTLKVGRQALDTPLAFTETWSIAHNTFEAAVALNQDIKDTTLVAAFVGRGNGGNAVFGVTNNAASGADPFTTYFSDGAFAFGAITTAIPNTTFQAWYYDIISTAQALWLQADIDLKDVSEGVGLGVQYATISPDDRLGALDDSSAVAFKLSGNVEGITVSAAYSTVDSGNALPVANTATNYTGGTSQSKLYTEAWWNYGHVGQAGTDSYNISAEYSMKDVADFGIYFTNADHEGTTPDLTEVALTASKSYGSLDTTIAYINAKDNTNNYNILQVYLTYNF
ncbi:OprD family outer membrane porin [Nitrosophilus labii]|uniref:OprD family outer membrane porin n=1 Tax=Nitrosophilus labii TaxID=2706014 RepID=UPI001657068E|nr:OprD family outer membrane porin [Nitrosophilus labii]